MKPHTTVSLYFQRKLEANAQQYIELLSKMTVKQIKEWCKEKNKQDRRFYHPLRGRKAELIDSLAHYTSYMNLCATDLLFKNIEITSKKQKQQVAEEFNQELSTCELHALAEAIDMAIAMPNIDRIREYDAMEFHNMDLTILMQRAKSMTATLEVLQTYGISEHDWFEISLQLLEQGVQP